MMSFPCVRMARASMRVYPARMSVYTVRMAEPNVAFIIHMDLSTHTTARRSKYDPRTTMANLIADGDLICFCLHKLANLRILIH